MKLRSALLLVVAATVCALGGLLSPQTAAASVDAVNQWPAKPTIAANNSTAATVTGLYTPGIGSNRLMLVAIAGQYASGTPTYTVTYGGQTLTGTIVTNTAQQNKIWLGFFNEIAIANGSAGNKILSIGDSAAATRTSLYATVAVFGGVDQATPITGSNAAATAAAASLSLSYTMSGNYGLAGNNGMSVYVTNWRGQPSNVATVGYSEIMDYAGATFNLAAGYKVTTGASVEAPQSTVSAGTPFGAMAGVGLNPALRVANITTCGDCHGNPPQDGPGTARNTPAGQFIGAHGKHAGKNEGQYGYLCTQCHYNQTVMKHQNGYKNISGSSVPRNTYGGMTNVPMAVSPDFTKTCSLNTCHSTGRTNRQYATSPTWNSTSTCLSCHGGRSNSTNLYARSTPNNFTLSTTHSQHLSKYTYKEINCNTCHGKTTFTQMSISHRALKDYTGAIYHANGTRNVLFTNIAYGSYTSYKSTESGSSANTKVCANTACHGGKTRSAWSNNGATNSDNTCVHCHGTATTSAALANSGANRRFFAPGYKVGGNIGTSTDQINVSNDIRVGSHFKHLSSAYMKNIKCNECHRVPSTVFDGTHMVGLRYNSQTLTFAQASTTTISVGVTAPANPSRLAAFAGYTSGTASKAATCSSVYCHGNRLKTNDNSGSYTKPYWNYSAMINYTDKAKSCGRCHGNPPRGGTAQALHKNYTAAAKMTVTCSTCHSMVVDATGKIINKDLHINGQVNADGGHVWSYRGSVHMSAAGAFPYTGCTGCHTNGSNTNYPPIPARTAPDCTGCHTLGLRAPSGTSSCYDCHGATATNAWPNGAAFPNTNRSHSIHSKYSSATKLGITCAFCHTGGGTGTARHGNYSSVARVQNDTKIGFSATVNGTLAAAWSVGAETCSTTKCHGSAASAAWGAVSGKTGCNVCHGYRSASWNALDGATATSDHRAGAHFSHISTANYKYDTSYGCLECHSDSISLATDLVSQASHFNNASSAKVNWATGSPQAKLNGQSPTYAPTTKGCSTVYCHGSGMASNISNPPASRVVTPIWKSPFLSGTPSTVGNGVSTPGTGNCSACHGFPPMTATHAGQGISACNGCHSHLNTDGLTFNDVTKHINGTVEATGDCLTCHAGIKGGRAAIVTQFNSQSHHVQGRAVTLADCYQCHAESADTAGNRSAQHAGTAGASVDLITWGTGTRGTSYISYTANGKRAQILKINAHCMGCHNSPNAGLAPFVAGSTTNKYSPEPRMAPALTPTSIQSRYSSTRTVPWSGYSFTNSSGQVYQYGTNKKGMITKAVSAHGNAVKNQFPNWVATANGTGEDEAMADIASATLGKNRNVLCYDCHNSHGSDAAGITSSYSSATGGRAKTGGKGGLLKSTVSGYGGYNVTYKPAARTIDYKNYSTTATHAATFNAGASICNDCHNNDTRKVNISRPWSITATYSSTKPIVGYWSTPYFDNYTFASAKRTPYKAGSATINAMKDLRKPMGGHYGSSANLGNYSGASHSQNINGLCTPCHDPHGVSSAMSAVNRGKSVPLLKGTWVTSPYREDRATPVVKRGGGSNFTGVAAIGAMPGYNIDQNTLINQPAVTAGGAGQTTAKSNVRRQAFTVFPGAAGNALALHTEKTPADFAGLCIGCHQQATLTNATAPSAANWRSKERVHQSVAGWAATSGANANGTVHAYTCSKCHAPHVSRLPRLMITNCLDVRHTKQVIAGGSVTATTPATTPGFAYGNVLQSYASSAYGAGRFPAGGSRYSGTPTSAQNNGPWYFQTVQPAAAAYGSNCHNSATAGGATYAPTNQIWNKKTRW